MADPVLSIRKVTKTFSGRSGGRTEVLADLDLDVAEGEFVAILGFSGCGKSTLVSIIAGLDGVDSGEVLVRGKPSRGPGKDRGVVFQTYSLMPWMTVEDNVRLSVDAVCPGSSRAERQAMVDSAIELVGLTPAKDRKPAQLSGGMRQRVAVARALAVKPEILVLDEPLSALDALTRAKLQEEIERIRSQERRTILLVTNDVDEAILLADRVAVLGHGPRAKVGRIFDVTIPRPRERTALNADTAYTSLRASIVTYLNDLDQAKGGAERDPAVEPPALSPADLSGEPRGRRGSAAGASARGYLALSDLTKVYRTPTGPLTVVEGFDLAVDRGEFISLIGHSGCGKSTVLSMAAGLSEPTAGETVLDGRLVTGAGPDKALVFQAPSLLPWLSARENVALGVGRVYPDASPAARREIVEYYLRRVGLGDFMDRRPRELSNGMRQRVGLARAFALSPKLLLLDEPFGMLDSITRWDLQDVLLEVWSRSKVTAVCVTHDVDEAILLADRVVMMTNGPNARIGRVLHVDLPRPRRRLALLQDPTFYSYRQAVLRFLVECEHSAPAAVA
ncbi:MAG: ABC transporter ATP-binding protein [Acidimicrobiales bacterium]